MSTTNPIVKPSGLRIIEQQEGFGKAPKQGQTISAHYTGYLEDGTVFDSSYNRNQPFEFPIGTGRVIRGWDEGFADMKEGGKRQLIIPPQLGYGDRPAGQIPPNSTLIFDVELLEVK